MTAIDLLHKVLDYYYLWSSPERVNSKPARSRLVQIERLLKGFEISKSNVNPAVKMIYSFLGQKKALTRAEYIKSQTNLIYFSSGEFINDRPKEDYNHLLLKITSALKSTHPEWGTLIDENRVDLRWLFNNLLQFRQGIYNIAYPHGGMLEGFSTGLEYSFYLQKRFKEIVLSNLAEIDETLCLLIDPAKRSINKEDIDYPQFDLETIDLNWEMENY
jgi:hypothetical protein